MNIDEARHSQSSEPAELAPLHVVLDDRRIAIVDGATTVTTLADVLSGAGIGSSRAASRRLTVDDRVVAGSQPLVHSGVRHGSRVGVADVDVSAAERGEMPVITAVWLRGVDAGGRSHLAAGRHFVGRARTASVRCDDSALELHHAVLDVGVDGSVVVSQLAGLHPVLLDGTMIAGPTDVRPGQRLEVGASVLTFRAGGERHADVAVPQLGSVGRDTDPWRVPWVRSPRRRVMFEPSAVAAPRPAAAPAAAHGGLLPAAIGVVGAAALALLFDQLMFLLFGVMGAVVAFGTWLAQRLGLIRSRRSAAAALEAEMGAFVAMLSEQRDECRRSLLEGSVTIDRAIASMTDRSSELWGVRAVDDDAFRVSIGEADGSWQPIVTGLGDTVGHSTIRSSRAWNDSREVIDAVENASRLGTVPVSTSLGAGAIVALVGDADAVGVARSMIIQMAASSGPADWRLVVISDRADEWKGLDWLPHLITTGCRGGITPNAAVADLITALDPSDPRHLLVVLAGSQLLSARTSPLRRLLAGPGSVACLVICATEAEVPAPCTSALVIGQRGSARWIADLRTGSLAEPVHIAGLSPAGAFDAAARVAGLRDPECAHGTAALPHEVRLSDLLGADIGHDPSMFASRIASRWCANGSDPSPSTPIGRAADGVIEIDLRRDGPHALLAGTTGAGKSELLRTLVVGIAARCSPEHVTFVLVDYKGGSTFDACAALPHTVGVVTDLDDRLAGRALRSLEAELRRREVLLRTVGANDLSSYRDTEIDGVPTPSLPRLVVVIDEFASLVVQQPAFISALLAVAQRGRSLGVHLLLATQRPSGVISDDIRANTNLRIALRVQDSADSTDVVGDTAAAYLPRSTPGRAMMRLGADELIDFQTATCTVPARRRVSPSALIVRLVDSVSGPVDSGDPADAPGVVAGTPGDGSDLELLVEAIRHAARSSGCAAPHRPWLEPLSAEMGLEALPAAERGGTPGSDSRGDRIVGIVDDPDHQTRRALTWPSRTGHLLLVGSPGSGTTTALAELAATLETGDDTEGADVFVIDANGDQRLDLVRGLSNCAGLVRTHERERLLRVLDHLCNVIDTRRASLEPSEPGTVRRAETVLMIDGLAALRTELDQAEQWRQLDQLERIVAEGTTAGIRVAISVERPGAVPSTILGQIARRWVFHLADPLDAGLLGLPPTAVPALVPGRLFDTAAMAEAQVIRGLPATCGDGEPDWVGHLRRREGLDHLGELAAEIDVATLSAAVAEGGDVLAPIGMAFDDLRPAVLPIACGEHVLVVGPARSGRTTVLNTIADRWSTAHANGWIGNVARRRSSARPGIAHRDVAALVAAMPPGRPVLIVIDDAELVDDPTGVLAARIANRDDNVTVVAAGRGDGLRSSYGHWSAVLRRSRLGLVMAAANELDGDLLGVTLPRRLPIAPRPGLAWLVADGGRRLVQVARLPARIQASSILG